MKYISVLLLWLVILTGTWTDMGQQFFGPTQELRTISKIEKAELVKREPSNVGIAVKNPALDKAYDSLKKRDYEPALAQYEIGLSNREWAAKNPKEWTQAAQTLLGLTIRVRNDPSFPLELISNLNEKGATPDSMRATVALWRAHAREWSQAPSDKNVEANIRAVRELLDRAETLQQQKPGPAAFILYLRSAALLKAVMQAQDKANNQEVSELASRSAVGLKDHRELLSIINAEKVN